MTSENVRAPSRIFWSPDGKTMVVVGYGGTETRLLNTQTGRVIMKLPYRGCVSDKLFGSTGCEPWIFSNDSRFMIRQEGPLKLWNAVTGELIAELESARAPVAFSPTNSRIFVTLSKDKGKALLWEVLD